MEFFSWKSPKAAGCQSVKVYEMYINQISRAHHEGIPSYEVKKSQIYCWVKLFLQYFFSLYWYFIETTTTNIDML